MPRTQAIQTNFTAGEISPQLNGRVDIAKYQNGAATLENFYARAHGGANRHPGTRYVAACKNANKKARAIPFVFSSSQAYILEFGDFYMRVFKDGGQVLDAFSAIYEIVTPYGEADLPDINYAQSADTMFLVHPSYAVRKLSRAAHADWKLSQYTFLVEPHDEVGVAPATNCTLSSAAVGAGVVATAAAAAFQPTDVGRPFTSGDGDATITAYTSATQVTITITTAFASVNLASGNWKMGDSPKTSITPSAVGPIGMAITLTLGAAGWRSDAQVNDVGRYVHLNGGVVEITSYASNVVVNGTVRSVMSTAAAAQSGGWTLETKVWNSTNGFPRAVTFFEQRLMLAGTTAFPNTVWGSRTGIYSDFTPGSADDDGLTFPLVSDQQNPIQQIASLRELLPPTYAGEFSLRGGVETPLTNTNVQARYESGYGIKNVRPQRVGKQMIFVQRAGRKLRALVYSAVSDEFSAPDISILSEHITKSGIKEMAYAQEPDSLMNCVRNDGQLVTICINQEQDVVGPSRRVTDGLFESVACIPFNDLDQVWTIVNRTIGGVTKRYMEYAEFNSDNTQNHQTDACVLGSNASIVNNVIVWAAGIVTITTASAHGLGTGGTVRVAGVTPAALNGDFLCTAGTAGATIKYALAADPGAATVLGTSTPLAKTWAGLAHLEGKTIDCLGDGVVMTQKTVVGGQVTLDRPVASVELGLHYESTLVTLPPEVPSPSGTTQGNQVSISRCTVRLFQSEGCNVEGEEIPFRKFGMGVLTGSAVPFTGDKNVGTTGWSQSRQLTIKQKKPLPCCVLAVSKKVTIND
jgi:hypothetical protein